MTALGNLVLAEDGELIPGLPVERFLEDVAVDGHHLDLVRYGVAVKEDPRLRRNTVENDGAVRSDNDLKALSQRDPLELEHRLLLGVWVQPRLHLVNENKRPIEARYVLGDAKNGPLPG